MNQSILKRQIFRPALNGIEVLEIAELFAKYSPNSEVHKKFATKAFQLKGGMADPVYEKQIKPGTAEGLGFDSNDPPAPTEQTLEQREKDELYQRYINDQMSPEEEKEFELSQGRTT